MRLNEISGQFKMRLGVDAGNISVSDLSFYLENGAVVSDTAREACRVLACEKGMYCIDIHIPNTYLGEVKETFTIEARSGRIVFGDACYMFQATDSLPDAWEPFLNKTDYLSDPKDSRFHSFNTGGDGKFIVVILITKLSDLPEVKPIRNELATAKKALLELKDGCAEKVRSEETAILDDISYFKQKLATALRIPLELLNVAIDSTVPEKVYNPLADYKTPGITLKQTGISKSDVSGNADKMWSAKVTGSIVLFVYGIIGRQKRKIVKELDTNMDANTAFNKAVHKKLKEGYTVVNNDFCSL